MGFSLNVAIADGIITATKGKANKEISYDTANASNIRSEIFDKKTRTQLHDEYRQETNYLWCRNKRYSKEVYKLLK